MSNRRFRLVCYFLVVFASLASSCNLLSPKPDIARNYLLNPIVTKSSPLPPPDPTLVLAVDLADVAEYLERPQMVMRLSPNEYQLDEFHRWSEPMRDGFSRVLARDIALYTDSPHVVSFPVPPSFGQEFDVSTKITQFDGAPGGEVALRAEWSISGPGGRPVYYAHESSFTRNAQPTTDPASGYVDALNALVGDLAHEIVNALPKAHAAKDVLRSAAP